MAKAKQRWAVRADYDGSPYLIFRGKWLSKPTDGWDSSQHWEPPQDGLFASCGQRIFEGIFPKCYHLPAGGGPVLIEFKEP